MAQQSAIPSLQQTPPTTTSASPAASSSSLPLAKSPVPPPAVHTASHERHSEEANFAPYTDDPEAGYPTTDVMLQTQRRMMDEQDSHLDQLAQSIGRQRDLSLQINEELDVHHGLLEEMDEELDRTGSRLSQARRKLDKVAKGVKGNSTSPAVDLHTACSLSLPTRFHRHDWLDHLHLTYPDYYIQDLMPFSLLRHMATPGLCKYCYTHHANLYLSVVH